MTVHVAVPDEVFSALRAHFDERQVLELTVAVGTYNVVSRALVALDVQASADPSAQDKEHHRPRGLLPPPCFPFTRNPAMSRSPNSTTGTTTSTARHS